MMIDHHWRHLTLTTESLKEKISFLKSPLWWSLFALVGLLTLKLLKLEVVWRL